MRIFVTGASGWIGSALVSEALAAGHQVLGMARSDAGAEVVSRALGAEVHRGDLGDLDSLREGAAAADGVVHLAYNHDFVDMAAAAQADRLAIDAMGEVLAGSGKPLVIASGTLSLSVGGMASGPGGFGTEDDVPDAVMPRVASEFATVALAERDVRSSVVRLSPTVHGEGDGGFVAMLVAIARDKGVSAFVGDGANRWPAVHRLDAAHLFRLAVEKAPAGSRLHGVGDTGIALRDIATVIGRHLSVPVTSIVPEGASEHFGFLGLLVQLDNPTSNTLTRHRLGWEPVNPGLMADLEAGHYFG